MGLFYLIMFIFLLRINVISQIDSLKIINEITSSNSFTLELNQRGCEHQFNEIIVVSINENNEYLISYENSKQQKTINYITKHNISNLKNCFIKEIYKIQDCLCTTNTNIVLKSNNNTIEIYYSCCDVIEIITPMTALKKALNINL